MKPAQDYKLILWDFDGVLMDSNSVRDAGFIEVLKSFPAEEVEQLLAYHRKNGGLSRYVKFRYFYEVIRKEAVTEEQILALASSFSIIMKHLLVNPDLLIKNSLDFVKKYHTQIPMHIVSGSDSKELNFLCESLHINNYFVSINGSPTHKNDLVKAILPKYNFPLNEVVLIGDSVNDLEAAKANGIEYIDYNTRKF